MHVTKSITINRNAEDVYEFWHDFENLPRFMYHIEMVEVSGPRQSHWTAKGPAGGKVEWDAEITEDRPNELIAWRSVGSDDDVKNAGSVRFVRAPGGRGTEVHVDLLYDPTGGKIAALFAKLFGEEPNQQIEDDLRRFKQVMELGEIVRSDGSPKGVGQGMVKQHPAQPAEREAQM